jgi:tripartite-type tricarboxylate transporter receptor subunit TctC
MGPSDASLLGVARARIALALLMLVLVVSGAAAQSVEQFYKGKTITVVVPADPGGSYDLNARLVSRHLGKWIPGRPGIVVTNMAGAGGLRSINYLYEKAPQDGTALGIPIQENVLADVLGQTDARYRIEAFSWIGRITASADFIAVWHTLGVRTIDDARRIAVPLGATGPASGTMLFPLMLNNLLGTRFAVTSGYKHTEMLLAMERGETAAAHTTLTTLKTSFPTWLSERKVNLLVAIAPERVAEYADVPHLVELGRNETERQVLSIFASVGAVGRSLLTTPGVPADRVAALRAAFDAMVMDPEFLAEIAKTHAELDPKSGAALQAMIAGTRNVPPAILERARQSVRR